MKYEGQPIKINGELNYYCTWASQNFIAMNEDVVFGDGGYADIYPEQRENLYLVFDDGWDVPYGAGANGTSEFGSLIVDPEKFPSYTGTPAERLKKFNDALKARGWRGLGIWVSPQMYGENYGIRYADDPEKHKEYWRERMLWCKYADVRYWKVDWGKDSSVESRRMMTELAKEVFPELVLEHAKCMGPINGVVEEGKMRFCDNKGQYETVLQTLTFAEAFRSYDVTDDMLSATSTLDRLVSILPYAVGVVNSEDELYMGVSLGCSVGIMRSHFGKDLFRMNRRLDEVAAAVKWQKYAPSFAGGELNVSDRILEDECFFKERDTWYSKIINSTVVQKAPAVTARNTELPIVAESEKMPFVLASPNPTGAYSLAAIKRKMYLENTEAPIVSCNVGNTDKVGVFGDFKEITLCFDAPVRSIFAESLIRGEGRELIASEYVDGNKVKISGELLDSFNAVCDSSDNAVMFRFGF